jgi:hypothetical protein
MHFASLRYPLFLLASFFYANFLLSPLEHARIYPGKTSTGSWKEISSAEELITAYPARVQSLFSAINLNLRAQLLKQGDDNVRIRVMQEGKRPMEVTVPLGVGRAAIKLFP